MRSYEDIKKEIVSISAIVDTLPDSIKDKAFEVLLDAYINSDTALEKHSTSKSKSLHVDREALETIAEMTNDGRYKFILRDPKAKNAKDAAKRIIYIVIRSYMILTEESGVSRKDVINPILNQWNLNSGNTRGFITNDKGIIKSGDILSLDKVAEKEADKFITQINDVAFLGKWKIKNY